MRRRDFVTFIVASALRLYVLVRRGAHQGLVPPPRPGSVKLIDAGRGLLDLPEGFTYVIVPRSGPDGRWVCVIPARWMACFLDAQGRYVLLRNHELGDRLSCRCGLDNRLRAQAASACVQRADVQRSPVCSWTRAEHGVSWRARSRR